MTEVKGSVIVTGEPFTVIVGGSALVQPVSMGVVIPCGQVPLGRRSLTTRSSSRRYSLVVMVSVLVSRPPWITDPDEVLLIARSSAEKLDVALSP